MSKKLTQKILSIILIAIIEFSNFAIPIALASDLSTIQPQIPQGKLARMVAQVKIDPTVLNSEIPGDSKMPLSFQNVNISNSSARKPRPFSLKRLAKKDFRAAEEAVIIITNPDNESITTNIMDANGAKVEIETTIQTGLDSTEIKFIPPPTFKPGKYTITLSDSTGKQIKQDFTWGVLAINTDKSVYLPKETAALAMAVLDEQGNMVCDAQVDLKITNTGLGINDTLSVANGKITVNPECTSHDYTLKPDYEANYKLGQKGKYTVALTAKTKNGTYTIDDSFEVRDSVPLDVKRISATRIFPPHTYPVMINVKADQDFSGTVTETVPGSFKIDKINNDTMPSSFIESVAENSNQDVLSAQTTRPEKEASPSAQPEDVSSDSATLTPTTPESNIEISSPSASTLLGDFVSGLTPHLNLPFTGPFPISLGFGEHLLDLYERDLYTNFGLLGHDGIDFAMPIGTPLLAVDEGQIALAGKGDYGKTIIIQHSWGKSYYGHLSSTDVTVGQKVIRGSQIGLSGNTGITTGPHLHFGIKPDANNIKNGYYGKINPSEYLGLALPVLDILSPSATAVLGAATISSSRDTETRQLTWIINLKKGETIKLAYSYVAPDISPQLYTLGPAIFTDSSKKIIFTESRTWSIAADAVTGDNYNWYKNINANTPVDAMQDPNQPAIMAKNKPNVRLRTDITNTGSTISSTQFKLQYADTISNPPADWCNDTNALFGCTATWSARKKITLNNLPQGLTPAPTNFPVMIKLSSASGNMDFDKTQFNGKDIRFVDPSNNNLVLPHEIEKWDEPGGEAIVWVKVPTIFTDSTHYIWMYYNNPTVRDGQQKTSVWDSNYKGVWHFKNSASLELGDSTTSNNSGSAVGNTAAAAGQIGGAINLDGTGDYVTVGGFDNTVTAATFSVWINADVVDNGDGLVFSRGTDTTGLRAADLPTNEIGYNWNDDPNTYNWQSGPVYSSATWTHIQVAVNSTTAIVYKNGVASGTNSNSHASSVLDALRIGSDSGGARDFDGKLDEVRISNIARPAGWMKAEYNSMKDTSYSTYYTFAIEEGNPSYNWIDVESSAGAGWCNDTNALHGCTATWSARRKITFNNSASTANLTDFPVMVKLSSASGNMDFDKTQFNGKDIRFVDPSNNNLVLPHEIEKWDEPGGEAIVWVKVPQIDLGSTTDYIWMYYNNSAPDGQQRTSVWETNYKSVWHLKEVGDGTLNEYKDSTANLFHARGGNGTSANVPARVDGSIGYAQDFDGSTEFINSASSTVFDSNSAFTMEMWINADTCGEGGEGAIFAKEQGLQYYLCDGTNDITLTWSAGGSADSSANSVVFDQWHHVVGTYNGSGTAAIYVDGVDRTADSSVPEADIAGMVVIGADDAVGAPTEFSFDGTIDEVRISSMVRVPDWIEAEYISQTDAMNSYGGEEGQATAVWTFKNNASVADGATITTSLLNGGADVKESYTESNPTVNNPNNITNGQKGEWDFSLDGSNAISFTTYYFRLVYSTGVPLSSYTRYPTLTVGPALSMLMRHGKWFDYKDKQAFTF